MERREREHVDYLLALLVIFALLLNGIKLLRLLGVLPQATWPFPFEPPSGEETIALVYAGLGLIVAILAWIYRSYLGVIAALALGFSKAKPVGVLYDLVNTFLLGVAVGELLYKYLRSRYERPRNRDWAIAATIVVWITSFLLAIWLRGIS